MSRGEFFHNLDAKGRMIVPVRFREHLGERYIITKGYNVKIQCLNAYNSEQWDEYERKLKNMPTADSQVSQFVRFFYGSAQDADIDAQGRSLIPQALRDYAEITKEIVSIGLPDKIEIWAKEKWGDYNDEKNYITPDILQRMTELGF